MTASRITYAGGRLDRAGARRKDPAFLDAALARDDSAVVPLSNDRSLVATDDAGKRAARVPLGTLRACGAEPREWTALGVDDGDVPVLAVELTEAEAARLVACVAGAEFVDLRRVGGALSEDDASLLAYARAMVVWHRRHRFCGTCGGGTESRHAGHMRHCTACGAEVYPRTDPAVIMLVERTLPDGESVCLLAHHGRLVAGMFSTLAGFVEPGESLEEAVAREVLEETGVRVSRVSYHASQPWPFPASLMIGFRAVGASSEIVVDADEIAEARWFTAAELRAAGEWGDDGPELKLPRRDSIARHLVEAWLADQR